MIVKGIMMVKRFLSKTGREEPGTILPLALVLMMAAIFIITPALGFMYSLLTINSNTQQDVAAYYAADAGVSSAYWYFQKNSGPPAFPYAVGPVNGMTVSVTQLAHTSASDNSSDNYTIQSIALVGSKPRATVVALIQVPAPGNNIFNQAVASLNGNVTVQSSGHIISDGRQAGNYGNIYANGNISVTPSSAVGGTCCSACNSCGSGTAAQGLASATGSVTVSNCNTGTCVGSAVSGAPSVSYTVNVQNFINQASAGTHYASNPVPSYGTFTFPGPAYITGDLTIAGSVTVNLTGTVYCTGNLTIGGSGQVKGAYTMVCGGNLSVAGGSTALLAAGSIPFIICQGTTVTVSGSACIAAVIYAPNAAATLSGGVPTPPGYNVYGAVIAKSVTVSSMTIEYMSGIHSETQIPGAGLGGAPVLIGYNYR
ncbi:MAG: polymer-forming cytoskeletal protein [Dehalococcoidia bacterium]